MRRLVWLAALACAGEAPPMMPPPGPDPNVALDALCGALAKVECERLEGCGLLASPIDRPLCERLVAEGRCGPITEQLAKTGALGHTAYDPLKGGLCRDATLAAACTLGLGRDLFAAPECGAIVTGLSAEGGACTFGAACATDLFCDASAARCPGACRRFRGNNESCGGSEVCDPSLFCAASARRCRARVALNAPCEPSMQGNSCVDSTFCDTNRPQMAVCVPARGRNTGCTSPFQCAAGLVCIRNSCSAGLAGDRCDDDDDCEGLLRCGGDHRCATPLVLGARCDLAGAPCALGLTCTSSAGEEVCRAQPVEGQPGCGANLPCFFSRCVEGQCAASVPDGGACKSAADCLPDRACADGLCRPRIACRL